MWLGSSPSPPPADHDSLLRLGSLQWLAQSGVDVSSSRAFAQEWSAQSATVLGLALEQNLIGLAALKDTLKAGSREVVKQLQDDRLTVYLVTGDNALTAAAIGAQAGIPAENVFAEVRPEKKAELVRQLQERGQRVAFVGDGINDAPALEQADLGIAVSRASDIAREAADIILLNSEIEAVTGKPGIGPGHLANDQTEFILGFFLQWRGGAAGGFRFHEPGALRAGHGIFGCHCHRQCPEITPLETLTRNDSMLFGARERPADGSGGQEFEPKSPALFRARLAGGTTTRACGRPALPAADRRRPTKSFVARPKLAYRFRAEIMKAERVRLFIKPYCGWCHRAIRWLDDHGIQYETLDVIADLRARDEMVKLSGQTLAPVIEVDGKILADFGPDQLETFWKTLEKKSA